MLYNVNTDPQDQLAVRIKRAVNSKDETPESEKTHHRKNRERPPRRDLAAQHPYRSLQKGLVGLGVVA